MSQAEQAGEPITRDEAIKLKWNLIYEGGGLDLQDKIGIAGGVANMADGGLTRTVAPDSGPMAQGIMATRTGFKDGSKKKVPWYLWPYRRAQEWDKIIESAKERLFSSDDSDNNY